MKESCTVFRYKKKKTLNPKICIQQKNPSGIRRNQDVLK
jgi:hypothetical protein